MHGPNVGLARRLQFGVAASLIGFSAPGAQAAESAPGAAILQELRSFNTVGTVLHVAAHPDDENTALITYFARGRGYRTAYLSLTRGDGGQNEIGPEFDEKLGLARTYELLAARKIDRGRQFFTRAIDFGYSKSADETLRFWDRQQVLGDVVRVIRRFRPDVVITRFSPSGGGTHGHHTASGILGLEAFKLAGDPTAYPEQLTQGLSVWQPKRVVLNGFGGPGGGAPGARGGDSGTPGSRGGPSGSGGRGGRGERSAATTAAGASVRVDIGGTDAVTGEGFAAIASRSRGQHITQGFGNFGGRGGPGGSSANEQSFVPLDGAPMQADIMDGIDTTWARFPGGAEIGRMAGLVIAQFKGEDPAASVPAILALRRRLATLPADPVIDDKRVQLDRILQQCLQLTVQSIAAQPEVVPGETLKFRASVALGANVPVKWIAIRLTYPKFNLAGAPTLRPGQPQSVEVAVPVPADAPPTQPYWLLEEGSSGIARVDDPKLIGTPENPPPFPVEYVFEVGGQTLIVPDEPVQITPGAKGERRRRVDVIPPVSLQFAAGVSLFAPGSNRSVTVSVVAARAGVAGALQLELPDGWTLSPASQPFRLGGAGEKATVTFNVTAPAQPTAGRMVARADIGGTHFHNQRIEINYPHLPLLLLQPPARARLVCLDVATRGKQVGYLPGAGDDTASALEQLGYKVTTLTGADLTREKLQHLDAVVIGVRAFNERDDLTPNLPGLFAYVENGGTVVAQYNRPTRLNAAQLGPYELSIQGGAPELRVTDENAPVTFLMREHPALNTPNKISLADFEGWVQERGAYFPSKWDERYAPLFAMSDPGEKPLRSGVLVAKYGKGHYVYTGIAFFRQLPAGVPGAYRLFANLVSLGN